MRRDLLADIHEHHGIGKKSLRHCKALLSTIFMHAKRAGVLDGAKSSRRMQGFHARLRLRRRRTPSSAEEVSRDARCFIGCREDRDRVDVLRWTAARRKSGDPMVGL